MPEKTINQADAPNFTIQREVVRPVAARGSSSAYWAAFQRCRVRAIHGIVAVKGTATGTVDASSGTGLDAAAGITIAGFGTSGTASVGHMTFGTQSVNHIISDTMTQTLEPGNGFRFLKGADGDLVAVVIIEFEVLPDAVMS